MPGKNREVEKTHSNGMADMFKEAPVFAERKRGLL